MTCEKCHKKTDLICLENDMAICHECEEKPYSQKKPVNAIISYQKVWQTYSYHGVDRPYDVDVTGLIFIMEEYQ